MKRLLASLLSVALLVQAGAAFAASETLELPFGGPPPRSVGDVALAETGEDPSGLAMLLRQKKRGPAPAGGRWSGRQGLQDAISRGRADAAAGREGSRSAGDGPRGSRGGARHAARHGRYRRQVIGACRLRAGAGALVRTAPCQPPRTGLPADHVRYRAGRPASARHASCRPAGPEAAAWRDRRAGRTAAGGRRGALAALDRAAGSEDRRPHRRCGNLCRPLRLRRPCGGDERGIALRHRPALGGLAARAAFLRLAPASARRRHAARPLQCARHRGGLAGALSPARRRDRVGGRGGRPPRALLPRPVAARPARRRPRPLPEFRPLAAAPCQHAEIRHQHQRAGPAAHACGHRDRADRPVAHATRSGWRARGWIGSTRSCACRSFPTAATSRATRLRWSTSWSICCRSARR